MSRRIYGYCALVSDKTMYVPLKREVALKVQTYHNISAPTGCLVNSCKFAGKKPTWNLIVRLGLLQFAQHNIVGLGLTNFYEGFTNLYINQYIYHKLNINYMYNTINYSYSDVYYHSSPRQSFHRGTKRGDWDARRVWVPGVWKWDPKMDILRFMLIRWDVYNDICLSVISIIVVVMVLLSI